MYHCVQSDVLTERAPVTEEVATLCDSVFIREGKVTLLESRDNTEAHLPLGQPTWV